MPGASPARRRVRLGGDAHRHLERELAEGAAREGRAGGSSARGRTCCSCRRPSSATRTCRGVALRRRATSSRTTARAGGTASRSRAACRDRRASSRTSASRSRRARTDDAFDDEPFAEARMIAADVRRRARGVALRAQRPHGRLALLRREARLVRSPRALARGVGRSRRAAGAGRRPQRRAQRRGRVGSARLPRRHARVAARARGLRAALRAWGLEDAYRRHHPEPGATPGGTTAPATSTRTSACASTTCSSTPPLAGAHGRGRRSTARRARASRSPPTTRRS